MYLIYPGNFCVFFASAKKIFYSQTKIITYGKKFPEEPSNKQPKIFHSHVRIFFAKKV
jgi:hypothetical protein